MILHAIIQARLGSTRLSNKVLKKIENITVLEHIINRILASRYISKVIVATTNNESDKKILKLCKQLNIDTYTGSSNDVLSRYFNTAKHYKSKNIIRITSDDLFKDYEIIDRMAKIYFEEKLDIITNTLPPTFPEGLDVEIFNFESLELAFKRAKTAFDKEHVTQFFYKNKELFSIKNYENKENLSHLRWTLDTEDDFNFFLKVYGDLYNKNHIFLMKDILKYLEENPEVINLNSNVKKSFMYQ
jgi:spore coat polysaccharide biosynthesis protein SpsF (cytidylyltransferase family)